MIPPRAGSLLDHPPLELLCSLATLQWTGRLRCVSGLSPKVERVLHLRQGQLVHASSNQREESLRAMLQINGRLDQAAMATLEEQRRGPLHWNEFEAVATLTQIPPEELIQDLARSAMAVCGALIAMETGRFVVEADEDPRAPRPELAYPLATVLGAIHSRIPSAHLSPWTTERSAWRLSRAVGIPTDPTAMGLVGEAAALWSQLDATQPAAQLAATEETARLLTLWFTLGWLLPSGVKDAPSEQASPQASGALPAPDIQPPQSSPEEDPRLEPFRARAAALEEQNHYEILGVDVDADAVQIRAAYLSAARDYHPDAMANASSELMDLANTIFSALTEANKVLSDSVERDKYTRTAIHGEKSEEELAEEQVLAALEADGHYRKGRTQLFANQLARALHLFQQAHEVYPDEPEYSGAYGYLLAITKGRNDDIAQAEGERLLNQAVERAPNSVELRAFQGAYWLATGEEGKGRHLLQAVLRESPDHPVAADALKRADGGRR